MGFVSAAAHTPLVGNGKLGLGCSSSFAAAAYLGNCFLVKSFRLLISKPNIITVYFFIETNVSESSRNKDLVSFVSFKSGVEKVLYNHT